MASSPETDLPPENTTMSSPPPPPSPSPPPPLQENPFLATAAPPEPASPDHATLTAPPSPGQATAKSLGADEPLPPPMEGTPDGAGPPPALSPRELTTSASVALEAASSEEPTSTSPPPPAEAVEVSPEATAAVASPPPSPQIAEASPEDAPPPSLPPTPPAPTSGALPDASSADAVAMASEEAAGPPPAPESMDADPHTAPAPPTPPLEGGPEGLLPQQQPQSPSSLETAPPGCENSETAQLPPPPTSPAETTYVLPDAAETDAVAVTSVDAAGSPAALEATDGETDTTPGVPSALKSEAEGSLQEPVPRPPSPTMEAEPCSPEMAPPGFENCKSSWLPLPPRTPPAESTHFLLDAAATQAVTVMPDEAAGSMPALKVMDMGMDATPGLPPPSSESGAEGPLQQPLLRPASPITQAEPCSPDMPPPGFENFKSSWLPLPTLPPPAETTYALPDVVATKAVAVTFDEVAWPVLALEEMNVDTDTARSLLPPLESGVKVLLQQPLLRPPSSVAESAPCSSEMAPPGFENFKLSWPPLPPLSQTAYVLPDAVATEALAVTLEEAARSPPALETMDVDTDATHPPPLPLERGVGRLLQEPLPRPSFPTMQAAPCSPDMAPPGFENFKSSQPLLPPAQTAHTLQDADTTEAVSVTEEAPWPLPSLEAMDANMGTVPALLPSSESGAEGSLPQQLPRLPPMEKGTVCSPDMVPSGYDNLESSQLLPQPALLPPVQTPDALSDVASTETVTVALEEAPHPPPVSGAMEEGTVPILPPQLESGSEGSLQQLESQAHSPTEHAADTLPDAPATKSVAVTSEETVQPLPALQAMDTSMDSATAVLPLSESGAEGSLPQPQHQPSSPTTLSAPCSLDSLQLLPPPPPPCLDKEMAQLVCGSCRDLLAYPRGAAHVQCAGCRTINLVLEAHEVGKVYCGRCETLLMYPFGAPAVKCSLCLFVTEIGERNVRPRLSIEQVAPRLSIEQVAPPHLPELTHQC